jgi:hypothetical protein
MSKQQQRAARKTKAMLGKHVEQLVAHTLAVSEYNGHGHTQGRQGRTGHPLPKSNPKSASKRARPAQRWFWSGRSRAKRLWHCRQARLAQTAKAESDHLKLSIERLTCAITVFERRLS